MIRINNKKILLWQCAGFAAISLGGILLHFLYDLTNKSILTAPFSAVNESTWEHMKLMFFPLFVFALIQSRFFKEYSSFWCVKLFGILTGSVMIPVLFYTCGGAFGKYPDWLNIAFFFLSAAAVFFMEAQFFKKGISCGKRPCLAFLAICLIGVMFVIFTFVTPNIPLFQDPLSGTYGR